MSEVSIRISADDQASTKLRAISREIDGISTPAQSANRDIGALGGAVVGFIAAIGISGVSQFVSDMYSMGSAANRAENAFRAAVAPVADYNETLSALQERTRGVVDDTTLMQGANRLLGMGLADTQAEVVDLLGMAVDLGSVFGSDATTSINDFTAMLANQSVERLDTFGISSGAVRQRIDELLASGQALTREQAFTMATLELGSAALQTYGGAIQENTSEVARFGTTMRNAGQDAAQGGADFVETLATGANVAIEYAQSGQAVITTNEQIAASVEGVGGAFAQANPNASEAIAMYGDTERLFEEIALASARFQEENARAPQTVGEISAALTEFRYVSLSDFGAAGQAAADFYLGWRADQEQADAQVREGVELVRQYTTGFTNAGDVLNEQSFALAAFADQTTSVASNLSELQEIIGAGGEIGGVQIFTADQADAARMMADEAARAVEQAALLRDQGLLGDPQVEQLQSAANEAARLADQAERGRDAFKDMSLDQLLGVTDGGAAGDLTDMITDAARDGGLTDEQIAQFQTLMDAQSGRSTETSTALMQEQIPEILAALQSNSAEAASELAMGVLNELASNAAGLPVEWSQDGFTAVRDNIAEPMAEAQAATQAISDNLATLTATPQVIDLQLNVRSIPVDQLAQVLAPALIPMLAGATRDNGGVPPGTNVRNGPF